MKIIPLILFQLFTLTTIGQTKSFYGEIHIDCVIYKGDTLKFDTPKIISFSKLGSTSIISLGKVKQTELAIQYDLLKSKIGTSEYFMLGKCFFVKTSSLKTALFCVEKFRRQDRDLVKCIYFE